MSSREDEGQGGRRGTMCQVTCATVSSLAYFCIGLVRAWAATGLPSLNQGTNETNVHVLPQAPLGIDTTSWIVSLPPLGAIVGSLLSSVTLNYLGRKKSIMIAGVLFFVPFLLIGLADLQSSVPLILIGRALSGLGVGLSVPSTSIYVAECSSPQLRGKLGSMPAFLLAFGILLTYVGGIILPWHQLAYACCVPALLLIFAMIPLPETPSYLARKGNVQGAAQSLAWLRGTSADEEIEEAEELGMAVKGDEVSGGDKEVGVWQEFFSKKNLYPLFLTLVLHLVQNWSGVNVIVFKTVNVFQTVGTSINSYACTAIVGGVQLVSTGFSIGLIDRAGRRPLLIISGLVMALSMASLAIFLQLKQSGYSTGDWGWVPLVSIILSFVGYSVGFATIPFCIMGELLPARTRNLSGPISSSFNLTCLFLVLKFYSSIANAIDYHGVFWLFTAVNLAGVMFVVCLLPETKGKSLQEIENMFQEKKQ